MIRALMNWLGLGRSPARVGLRPRRDITLPLSQGDAHARLLSAMETVLGANVYADDPANGVVEAGFGLVNNERVRVYLEPVDAQSTHVRIEALFPAGATVPERSRAVDALADALSRG